MQKYKRGDIVRTKVGQIVNGYKNGLNFEMEIAPEYRDKLAAVQYSYAEKYGGSDVDSYCIIFLHDGRSVSWYQTNELEFVEHRGERAIIDAKKLVTHES